MDNEFTLKTHNLTIHTNNAKHAKSEIVRMIETKVTKYIIDEFAPNKLSKSSNWDHKIRMEIKRQSIINTIQIDKLGSLNCKHCPLGPRFNSIKEIADHIMDDEYEAIERAQNKLEKSAD